MEAPIAAIKPNIKKALISNIIFVLGIVILIIGSLIYLNIIVGLDIFLDTFKGLGINISSSYLIFWFVFFVLFFTSLLLLLNYANLGKIEYTLYPNKIVYTKSFFIIHIKDKEVPYGNIPKITYEKKPFLNTSKIIIELTGMKEKKIELDFIDTPEEVVRKIQELIKDYRAKYYAQYTQDYRYQNIMDKY